MEIGLVPTLFKTEAARARGEQISEFKIARLYVDSMWSEIEEMLDSGISKADVVGMLMMTARVSRTAAYNTLTNRLNSNLNRKSKETTSKKVKSEEVSKASVVESKKPAPVAKPTPAAPVAPANSAASAKSGKQESQEAVTATGADKKDKWAHLRNKQIIVGKGFLGEEDKWMTPEEIQADKDRRARIEEASIASGKLEWKK